MSGDKGRCQQSFSPHNALLGSTSICTSEAFKVDLLIFFAQMHFTYPWLTTVQNACMETELYLYCCVSVFFICIVVNLYFVQQKKILLLWTFLHRIYCRTWKNTQNFDHHHHHVGDDESFVWKMTNSQTGDIFPISDLKLFRFASDVSIKYFWHFTTNLFFSILFVLSTYSLAGLALHRQGLSLTMCQFWKFCHNYKLQISAYL